MRKSIIASHVSAHIGGSFGNFNRVYRDTPDGEHEQLNFLGGDDADWGHDTAIDGNNLITLDTSEGGSPDGIVVEEEEPDSELEKDPDDEEEEEQEEEEDPDEEEEEPEEEEEQEEEEQEEEQEEAQKDEAPAKADVRTPAEKKADSAFKALRIKEKEYRDALKANEAPLDLSSVNAGLITERNTLIRERAALDPVGREDDVNRMADIDIQLADIQNRLLVGGQEAAMKRNSLTDSTTRAATEAVNSALEAISTAYPVLDSAGEKANEKAIRYFNMVQKSYIEEDGLSVSDSLEKALKDTVELFNLRAAPQKLSKVEKEKKTVIEARNGVKKRLETVKKTPVRGSRNAGKPDVSLASLIKSDFGDKKVQEQLNAQLGIRFTD